MKRRNNSGEPKSENENEFSVCDECYMGFCDECEHIEDSGEDVTEREHVEIRKAIGSDI